MTYWGQSFSNFDQKSTKLVSHAKFLNKGTGQTHNEYFGSFEPISPDTTSPANIPYPILHSIVSIFMCLTSTCDLKAASAGKHSILHVWDQLIKDL